MFIYKHLMSRLLYFWVDLGDTCVDLDSMISFLYGRKIVYNQPGG